MFDQKVVLVTGSSRGIGKAIALAYAQAGAHVILNCSKSFDELESVSAQIQKAGGSCTSFCTDVSQYDCASHMFQQIYQKHRKIDLLINNAGVSHVGLFTDMTPIQWKQLIDINIHSVLNCCHLVIPKMVAHQSGNIINISSIWGIQGASCEAVYSATKGAVNSFTKALAKELGPSNIRVNGIACGVIDTQMNTWLTTDEKADLVENIPLMRFGTPQDVANLCTYLSSTASQYLTGQIITLDGGMI